MNTPSARLRYISRILRCLPAEARGKARLARGLLGGALDTRDVFLELDGKTRFLVPSLREPIGFYLATDGVYDGQILDFVLRYLPSEGVFLDVGANIGCFTVPVAQSLKNFGKVIALEAAPDIFPYLEKNVALNGLVNVKTVPCAVSHEDGAQVPFYPAPADHFGMGSLAPQFHNKPVLVATRTLDSLLAEDGIRRVDVIKVDVEGFEYGVFQGAEKLLRGANPPVIIFEFCDWAEERAPNYHVGDAQLLLQNWGYQLWRLADYVARQHPLRFPLTEGFETLVARREPAGA